MGQRGVGGNNRFPRDVEQETLGAGYGTNYGRVVHGRNLLMEDDTSGVPQGCNSNHPFNKSRKPGQFWPALDYTIMVSSVSDIQIGYGSGYNREQSG